MQSKSVFGALIAAAAVYAWYRVSQMSAEGKMSLKDKAKRFIYEKFGFGENNFVVDNEAPVTDRSVKGS